jgi:hypothetical protein
MRGYGRDYHDRSWFDRAGETVRGWFGGGGHDYDRDYGREYRGIESHGRYSGGLSGAGYTQGRDYDRGVNWNNRGNTWNGGSQSLGGGYGGYSRDDYGADFHRGPYDRETYTTRGGGFMGTGFRSGGTGLGSGNYHGGGHIGNGRYFGGADYDRDFGGGYSNRYDNNYRGGQRGTGRGMDEMGSYGYQAGGMGIGGMGWGDYNRGAYGGDLFRNSRSGGVEPGKYFRGYGIGSSGGNGYSPY